MQKLKKSVYRLLFVVFAAMSLFALTEAVSASQIYWMGGDTWISCGSSAGNTWWECPGGTCTAHDDPRADQFCSLPQ